MTEKPKLSPRQLECLSLIARGRTSTEIAAELGLTRRTVDEYIGDLCARLGVKTRSQAVAVSLGLNLIPPPPLV
jgi:DNA-binding CsgD family transcriptional regulator